MRPHITFTTVAHFATDFPHTRHRINRLGHIGTRGELSLTNTGVLSWVNSYRREHAGEEPPLTLPEPARLGDLER